VVNSQSEGGSKTYRRPLYKGVYVRSTLAPTELKQRYHSSYVHSLEEHRSKTAPETSSVKRNTSVAAGFTLRVYEES
jgi:hypothetical protein